MNAALGRLYLIGVLYLYRLQSRVDIKLWIFTICVHFKTCLWTLTDFFLKFRLCASLPHFSGARWCVALLGTTVVTPYGLVPTVGVAACATSTLSRDRTSNAPGSISPPPTVCCLTKRTSSGPSLIYCPLPNISGADLEGEGTGIEYLTVITITDIL
jgi:hypothetical protein